MRHNTSKSSILRRILLLFLALLLLLLLGAAAFMQFHPVFGGEPDAASREKMLASPHFDGQVFRNFEPVSNEAGGTPAKNKPSVFKWLWSILRPPQGKQPSSPLPAVPFDLSELKEGHVVWFGHSTVLMRLAEQTVLFDPVFSRASPIFIGGKPFPSEHPARAEAMPPLDAVVISHDHYDHLDQHAISALSPKTARFYVPLGVKAHLQRWGVPDEKIIEMDWFEHTTFGTLEFIFLPTRHFSGRKLNNRFSTLWGSWIVRSPHFSVYFSGDSGYGKHFAEIGQRFGPFDIVLIENGSYNPDGWPNNHMTPEQSVQASLDLGAKLVLPIHWAKFDMAYHNWRDPIERFTLAAKVQNLAIVTPKIGEIFSTNHRPTQAWWQNVQ